MGSLACGLFSAMAGSDGYAKFWRRYMIPFTVLACIWIFNFNFWFVFIFLLAVPYTMGHGVPSKDDEKASSLGRFFFKLTNDVDVSNILVRFSKGVMKAIACLCLPLVMGNWLVYIIGIISIITVNILFGGDAIVKGEGEFDLFGIQMLWEEFIIAASDVAFILLIAFVN